MRNPRLTAILTATAFAVLGALAPVSAPAQQPSPQDQQPAPAPPKPYKPVPVQLPKPLADQSFEGFRNQIVSIAQKKDRAGLAQLVATSFFWVPEDRDAADKRKSGIDNLAKAINLDGREGAGWQVLATFAAEPSADTNPDRPGVVCAPGEPRFDENAAEELITSTQTEPSEWGYATKDGIEVRAEPNTTSPVIEKLGVHLVRAYPDDSPASAVAADYLRIVAPSGKLGFILVDTLAALVTDQLCYVKEGAAWKIAGVIGGAIP